MKIHIKKVAMYASLTILAVVLLFIAFLIYSQLMLPKHQAVKELYRSQTNEVIAKDTITIMTWNIGYCGLGQEMDFFYDGGTRMRTTEAATRDNISNIGQTLATNSDADILLLQEIDRESKRSYYINQEEELGRRVPEHHKYFASNYEVGFIPMPLSNPMGKVSSGIETLSKVIPEKVNRHSYPDKHPWPEGIFMPKRCFMESRYKTSSSRELIIINTHSSAYDNGQLRKMELNTLRSFVTAEYKKGNWVIVGGDWNQTPTGYEQKNIDTDALKHFKPSQIPEAYFSKGWELVWDRNTDTNRFLNHVYEEGKTMTTTLDFFLISPNVRVQEIKVIKNGFKHSDHQPVKAKFILK